MGVGTGAMSGAGDEHRLNGGAEIGQNAEEVPRINRAVRQHNVGAGQSITAVVRQSPLNATAHTTRHE